MFDEHYTVYLDVFVNGNLDVGTGIGTGINDNDNDNDDDQGVKYDILGLFHHWVKKDYEQALDCWTKAVEKGCVPAMINLGTFYKNIGNHEQTVKYYTMSKTAMNKHSVIL